MKPVVVQLICKKPAFLFSLTLGLILCVSFANLAGAQCATGTAPSIGSCTSEYYKSITASGTGVTSTISYTTTSCSGTYFDNSATQGITCAPGTTVNLSITRATGYSATLNVYVDWNNTGSFTAAELVGTPYSFSTGTSSTTYSFTVPATGIVTGTNLYMRIMVNENSGGPAPPCSGGSYGEAVDYYINVNCPSLPTIAISPTADSFCSGGSGVSLTASGAGVGGTYAWTPASGLSATTGATVTSVPVGTTIYTITGTNSTGCSNTNTVKVTVKPAPATIVAPSAICASSTVALSDGVAGGTWSSSNGAAATVNAAGNLYSVSPGVTTISYTLSDGCMATSTVTVNTLPAAITGSTNVCLGLTTSLSDPGGSSGVWTSDNTAVATVDPATGMVSGVSLGTATIFYTLGTGCDAFITVTVNAVPGAITGTTHACAGSATTLSDATGGGIWSSNNTSVATVDATGIVSAVSAGTSTITYTTAGGCIATAVVTIYALPSAITGPRSVCAGSSITLSDATAGGTWSSGAITVATVIAGSGVVAGASAGPATITYTSGAGCTAVTNITVNALPAAITGGTTICFGSTTTLSDATAGGTWGSDNISVATAGITSGVISGVSAGTANITYTLAGTGCATSVAVTVSPLPSVISGANTVCAGSTIAMSDASPGGVWSSDNLPVATVSGAGIVSGVSGGTADISYAVGTCSVGMTVTVATIAAITGPTGTCAGSTIVLSDATPGGIWSSDNSTVATVSMSGMGIVAAVSSGTTDISYTVGSCSVGLLFTVSNIPPILGSGNVCVGLAVALSDATPGGVWSSTGPSVATISTGGVVTGVVSGGATISYTIGSCAVTMPIAVGNAISAISGTPAVCTGSTTNLVDGTPGGAWSSGSPAVATVSGAGAVKGITAGTDIISYTVGACSETMTVTVDADNVGAITGRDTVCIGSDGTLLSDAVSGGIWSSSNTVHATVAPGSGLVTGLVYGIDTIKYTVTNMCGTYTTRVVMHILTAAQCPAGVAPVSGASMMELKVFPNPNNGTFTMNLSADHDEEVRVIITNLVGEKVREFVTATNKATDIKLQSAPGMYLLSAATASGGRYVARIVVY